MASSTSFYKQNKGSPALSHHQFTNIKSPPMSSGSPYLPNYLLGSASPASSPAGGSYNMLISKHSNTLPLQQQTSRNPLSYSPPFTGTTNSMSPERRIQRYSSHELSPTSSSSRKEKPGAPPTESLYNNAVTTTSRFDESISDLDVTKRLTSTRFAASPSVDLIFSPNKSSSHRRESFQMFTSQKESIVQSPAQIDPFYSQGDTLTSSDVLNDTAVTVFGFPPAASSFILQQFSQYGTIENHEIHNTGNWLHIKYQTKIQAKKALSKNGKVFARSIMIGVCPCIKKDLTLMEEQENSVTVGTPYDTPERPRIGLKRTNPSASIRSLSSSVSTSHIQSPYASNDFTSDKGTPQKKNSVVTKALDYVFGW